MEKPVPLSPPGRRNMLLTIAFFLFLGVALYSAAQIFIDLREYIASENEYEKLRAMCGPPEITVAAVLPSPPETEEEAPVLDEAAEEEEAPPSAAAAEAPPAPPAPPRDPAEINPEYAGWLKISGAKINYPVAKGADNEKYLNTSFEGRKSGLGAIFMDYRCASDFSGYHTIVYGHNAKTGAMFGTLAKYADEAYLEKNRIITVTLPDGQKDIWRIFAAYKSDISDPSYRLDFSGPESFAEFAASLGAPEGTAYIMTLSTCTTGGSNDERMLVHAAIVQ